MYFLKINNKTLPTPSYYSVDTQDIDSEDSRRSDETGVAHRNRIRSGVKTCDVKWIIDGGAAESLHINLSEPVLKVSMLDPAACGYIDCDMYASNIKSVFYQQQSGSEGGSYWEISCRLVQY